MSKINRLIQKVGFGIASATLLASVWAPAALADTSLEISGNGAHSQNSIDVTSTSNCDVKQTSNTSVVANISASASSGGNQASGNTGGNVSIDTGSASASASLDVTGGSNIANNPCCCVCNGQSADSALISGNGKKSENAITLDNTKNSKIRQRTNTSVVAGVSARAKTGKNKTKNNTGPGDVTITTGDAGSTVGGTVSGGSNVLNGCGCDGIIHTPE